MSTNDTPNPKKNLPRKKDNDRLDREQVPEELTVSKNPVALDTILSLPEGEEVEFNYGDFIPNATSFNQYLEANVRPGDTLKLERNACLTLIKRLTDTLNTGGLSSLPMVCMKEDCDKYQSCTIAQAGIPVPVGEPCPLERSEILNHVRNLAKDFGGDRTYADQLLIQGVAGIEVLKGRTMAELAKQPKVIVTAEKGTDNHGNVIKEKVANPAFTVLNNLTKNELSLLKSLSMTAQERMKNDLNRAKTADEQAAAYRAKLAKLRSEGVGAYDETEVQDAEFTVLNEEENEQSRAEGQVHGGTDGRSGEDAGGSNTPHDGGRRASGEDGIPTTTGSESGSNENMEPETGVDEGSQPTNGRDRFEFHPGFSPFQQRGRGLQDSNSGDDDTPMEVVGS